MDAPSSELFCWWDDVDGSYGGLPRLYLGLLAVWSLSTSYWALNTRMNRHFQLNNLQWILASVSLIKVLQLGMSFLFWHSCFKLETCSLWMSFGVYVSGILFQTASFVCFLLISHGYCTMCEHLSVNEQRTTAALGCVLYLTLVGYRANVPYFTVFMMLNYFVAFYMIFHHLSQNLFALSEQINLSFIENDNVHPMHSVMQIKYSMFKKFQGAMQIVAVVEIVIYMNIESTIDDYSLRLLVREWAQLCIFIYIGWIFRPQEVSPLFSVMPTVKCRKERALPPVYSLEIDAADFKDLTSQAWQIGVPTSLPCNSQKNPVDSVLVVVQHPGFSNRAPAGNHADQKSSGRAVVAHTTTTCSHSYAENREE
uniref:tRNA dimethylallyltransferase n=1 Tax=Anthurium amnicola TaxID=1678845 RepID=A0A1D1YIG8_9ARAE